MGARLQASGGPVDVAAIEASLGGRIGFYARDTGSNRAIEFRPDERFATCSTFKAALAAAVLSRIDRGEIERDRQLAFDGAGLLPTSPITTAHVDSRISVIEACEAVVSYSDNTAANLLLREIGGPPAMTAYFRELGDEVSRIDRYELDLNSNLPGDPRDTTTPRAMAETLERLLLGDALRASSRNLLTGWMVGEQNGKRRSRARLPSAWLVANKPGTSANGATNDIAIAWRPSGAPIVLATFVNAPEADGAAREGAIAEIVRLAAVAFGALIGGASLGYFAESAATPGSSRPSIHSRKAPPAVEM